MKMDRFVVLSGLMFLATACNKGEGEPTAASASASASTAVTTATAAASPTPPPAPVPAPVPKQELAGKPGESIDGCCSALKAVAKTGKGAVAKDKADRAAEVCGRVAKLVKDGKTARKDALTQIRSSLAGASIPSECQ